jgi:hypothetical protein
MNEPPVTPSDDAPDTVDDALHVSSLRPAPQGFSMRRLLNIASIGVVAVVLLALAIHWLPDVLPKPAATPNPLAVHAQQTLAALRAMRHGAGWRPIGPDWAQDIAFSADGSVGYACGAYPGRALQFIAVYRVIEDAWYTNPPPIPDPEGVVGCGLSVSPIDPADVVLSVDRRAAPSDSVPASPTSRVYRSYDGGGSWNALKLPPATLVGDIAWVGQSTLLLVAGDTSTGGASAAAPTYSLLVSRKGGPLTEIPARSLVGYDTSFGSFTLISSGVTLYASLHDTVFCPRSCERHIQSSDEGRSWTTQDFSNLAIRVINVEAALPGTSTLIGTTFEQAALKLFVMRSDDGGASWRALPSFPVNPGTGGANLSIAPDGAVYAFCFGNANAVYALPDGASSWRTVASLPLGYPVTVQYGGDGHAVALWAQAHDPRESVPGLAYFPLPASAP